MSRVRVAVTFEYELPDDPNDLVEAYGTADPAECVKFDIENDPEMFVLESEILDWKMLD